MSYQWQIIKNIDELLREDKVCDKCLRARKVALRLIEEGLKAADPYKVVYNSIEVQGPIIKVCGIEFKPSRIFIVGFGKASINMAKAVEDKLKDKICEGVISAPKTLKDEHVKLTKIKIVWSGHPYPDEGSIKAGRLISELVKEAKEDDLVIALVSGGGSALMEYPANNITLSDFIKTTELLLKSGAVIQEINAVRKHISLVKGGWLAYYAYPAKLVSLIISDVVGDDLSSIASGPTVPDPTTFNDAVSVLKKYGIWDKVPDTVRKYLSNGLSGKVPETPKPGDKVFNNVHNFIVASNIVSLKRMAGIGRGLGYNTIILTSLLEGEAREVGKVLASIALDSKMHGIPVEPPAIILAGGETTVTVRGKGKGGRNQELALSAAFKLANNHGIALASVGSDGIDGITPYAGGIIDAHSINRAIKLELNPEEILMNNNSYEFFKNLGDGIYTGPTGTNVNDFQVIIIER